jgi:hypothetical protein
VMLLALAIAVAELIRRRSHGELTAPAVRPEHQVPHM